MPSSDKVSNLWMNAPMATLDCTGQYRRDLGWKLTSGGKRAQQRFYLGRDKNTAQVSETRLQAFWSALEGYFDAHSARANRRSGKSGAWGSPQPS
jgi:hypothetical protein